NQILVQMKAKSPQMVSAEDNIDFDHVAADLQGFEDKFGQQAANLPRPGEDEQSGGSEGNSPFEKPPAKEPSPFTEGKEEAPDPDEIALPIAEILYHLHGADALKQLQAIQEEWEASGHPRGKGGRFIPRGSAEAVAVAKKAVNDVLNGKGGDAKE